MRPFLVFLFTIVAAFSLQAQQFVVKAENKPLNKLLVELQDQYKLQFSFDDKLLSKCIVNDSATYKNAEEAIARLTQQCNLAYRYEDDIFIIYSFPESLGAKPKSSYHFTGKIIDPEMGETLPYSFIQVNENRYVTDVQGNFAFKAKDSTMHIQVSYLGYSVKDTVLTAGLQHEIFLKPSTTILSEVVIKIDSSKHKSNDLRIDRTLEPGVIKLNHSVATLLPGTNSNTLFNLMRLQPGILAAGEQTNDYHIWGSYQGQTQIVYDGITLFSIGSYNDHVGAVNPMMVKDIEVYKAGYNVDKGDERVGGFVDITGTSGNTFKPVVKLQFNQLIGSAYVNIPIAKKYTLQTAFRYSYYDFFPNPIEQQQSQKFSSFETDNNFKDFNIKFSGNEKNGDHYYVTFLKSRDFQSSSIENFVRQNEIKADRTSQQDQIGMAASYNKVWSEIGVTNFTVAHSSLTSIVTNQREEHDFNRKPKLMVSDAINYVSETSAKVEHSFPLIKKHQVSVGAAFIQNVVEQDIDILGNKINDQKMSAGRTTLFLKDKISLHKNITLEPGLKFVFNLPIKQSFQDKVVNLNERKTLSLLPRISLLYTPSTRFSVQYSTGYYQQYLVENTIQSPFDNTTYQWAISDNQRTGVVNSVHQVLGTSYRVFRSTIKVEGFYKKTVGLTTVFSEEEFFSKKEVKRDNVGKAFAETVGLDFYLEKQIKNHSFWLSYTLSKSLQTTSRFGKDVVAPSPYDQRHEIKGSAMFAFKPFYASLNYVYGSGLPTTFQANIETQARIPYSRLDAALMYKTKIKKVELETGVSVINILNTQNIMYTDYLISPDNRIFYARGLPFTPSVFLNFTF